MRGFVSTAGLAHVPDEIGVDERAQERGPAEDELGQDGVEGVVLLAAGDAQQGIDGHLEGGHAGPDEEERDDGRRVAGERREEQGPGEGQDEGPDHDRLLPVALDEHARGDGHDAVGDEEGEGQKGDQGQAEVEALDDVGDERPDDVRQERDDEEGQHHQGDHAERAPGGRGRSGSGAACLSCRHRLSGHVLSQIRRKRGPPGPLRTWPDPRAICRPSAPSRAGAR